MSHTSPAGNSAGGTSGPDTASLILEALGTFTWRLARTALGLLWWAVLFPMLSLPAALAAYTWWHLGWVDAACVAVALVIGLISWALVHPASWRAAVSARIRARRRRWRYRKGWARQCALHGLTVMLDRVPLVPRLGKIRIAAATDVLAVRMVSGQTLSDWTAKSEALAHAWQVPSVTAMSPAPGVVVLTVRTRDPLAQPILLSAAESTDLHRVPAGVTEDGHRWTVRLADRHMLVAGATGSGKGSVLWSLLAGIGPAVHDGVCQLWVIDPKGGMEFGAAQTLFTRFAHSAAEDALELLRDAARVLADRADRLRGIARQHTPTRAEPLIVVVVDELASLTAYQTDKKLGAEAAQLLSLILSQGRAVGVVVLAAVQDPSKEVVAFRQLFPTRIGLRMTEATQVDMALGQGSRAASALCDQIPDRQPGVGYVIEDGAARPIRVRAFLVTDAQITDIAARYALPTPDAREAEHAEK
ncbi:FtsK/SpoIIIE domain-containing protein [Gryllotalpicola reticulitermitis]|uniref:FtsK/SpoIIIE domain-containing protein n=1 Tax=Gryllotalpicola reticulitermitis TaxID=1184153 RepID=A0ABV8QD31_9MICO